MATAGNCVQVDVAGLPSETAKGAGDAAGGGKGLEQILCLYCSLFLVLLPAPLLSVSVYHSPSLFLWVSLMITVSFPSALSHESQLFDAGQLFQVSVSLLVEWRYYQYSLHWVESCPSEGIHELTQCLAHRGGCPTNVSCPLCCPCIYFFSPLSSSCLQEKTDVSLAIFTK